MVNMIIQLQPIVVQKIILNIYVQSTALTQNAHSHKTGHGCRYCAIEENHNKSRYTLEDFIKRMRKVHGDKYDFSQAEYIGSQEEITLICHEKDALENEH